MLKDVGLIVDTLWICLSVSELLYLVSASIQSISSFINTHMLYIMSVMYHTQFACWHCKKSQLSGAVVPRYKNRSAV